MKLSNSSEVTEPFLSEKSQSSISSMPEQQLCGADTSTALTRRAYQAGMSNVIKDNAESADPFVDRETPGVWTGLLFTKSRRFLGNSYSNRGATVEIAVSLYWRAVTA